VTTSRTNLTRHIRGRIVEDDAVESVIEKNDKIESLADFFIYRKGPASGSGYVTD